MAMEQKPHDECMSLEPASKQSRSFHDAIAPTSLAIKQHTGHGSSYAFSSSSYPDDDVQTNPDPGEVWKPISDLGAQRRIQNRIAQRNYRRKLARRLEDLEKRASWEASDSYEHAKRTLVGGNGQDVAKTAATSLMQIIDTDTRSGSSSSHPFAMKCLRAMGIYLAKSSSKSLSQENFLKVVHSRSSDSRFVFGRVIQWAEKWLELSIQVDVTDETSIEEANPVDGERSTDEHREQLPDTSAESSSPGSSRGSDQKNASKTSKRKTTERGSVDEDDSEADPDSHNPKKTKADSKSNLRFACPYFKKNPSKHIGERTCVGPGWSSVRRVKEHVYRRHALPKFRCGRCCLNFLDSSELTSHQRMQPPCKVEEEAVLDGMTMEQGTKLRCRKKEYTSKPEEDKWYDMYCILFPEVDRLSCPSPYYDQPSEAAQYSNEIRAEFINYKRFLQKELPQVLRQQLKEQPLGEQHGTENQKLDDQIINIFQATQLQLLDQYLDKHTTGRTADDGVGCGELQLQATLDQAPQQLITDEHDVLQELEVNYMNVWNFDSDQFGPFDLSNDSFCGHLHGVGIGDENNSWFSSNPMGNQPPKEEDYAETSSTSFAMTSRHMDLFCQGVNFDGCLPISSPISSSKHGLWSSADAHSSDMQAGDGFFE